MTVELTPEIRENILNEFPPHLRDKVEFSTVSTSFICDRWFSECTALVRSQGVKCDLHFDPVTGERKLWKLWNGKVWILSLTPPF